MEKKKKEVYSSHTENGSISVLGKKMAINTEAFIHSATTQMKAQKAPGEQSRERHKTREPAELSGGARERWMYSHSSPIYLHRRY